MKIQAINNSQNFGARIRINKALKEDLLTGTLVSSTGTAATASGALSVSPIFDPAHHIHAAAKVVDASAASTGAGFITGGIPTMRFASSFFKSAIKDINKKIPS